MFTGKDEALQHRNQVLEVLEDSEVEAYHIHPVLDGAAVRIQHDSLDTAREALDEHGFGIVDMGESGDWKELKATPNDG